MCVYACICVFFFLYALQNIPQRKENLIFIEISFGEYRVCVSELYLLFVQIKHCSVAYFTGRIYNILLNSLSPSVAILTLLLLCRRRFYGFIFSYCPIHIYKPAHIYITHTRMQCEEESGSALLLYADIMNVFVVVVH